MNRRVHRFCKAVDDARIAGVDEWVPAFATAMVYFDPRTIAFDDLAGRLRQVVRFDFLTLVLHEAATDTMRLHVLETSEPVPPGFVIVIPPEEDPAGLVWQTQQPLIISCKDELRRWPRLLERAPRQSR